MFHKFEFRRQVFHILFGVVIAILYSYSYINAYEILALLVFGALLSFLSTRFEIPFVSWFLRKFERQKVKKTFPGKGVIFYLIGVFLVMLLFEKSIALASIMILALGDGVSHIIGRYFGRTKTFLSKYKLLEGSIAGFAVAAAGASFFVSPWRAVIAAAAAMTVELVELKINEETVDDNLVVPLAAALVLFALDKIGFIA